MCGDPVREQPEGRVSWLAPLIARQPVASSGSMVDDATDSSQLRLLGKVGGIAAGLTGVSRGRAAAGYASSSSSASSAEVHSASRSSATPRP